MEFVWTAKAAALLALMLAAPAIAQSQESDNGTDPTKLRRTFWTSYEHMDLSSDASRGTFKLMYEAPISPKTSLRLTLPVVGFDAPGIESGSDVGDIALRATHLLSVTRERGIVLQGELIGDTAGRAELGYGATVVKATAIYAKFLEGGRIFAPAISHTQSIGGDRQTRETTIDFYYVPKLPDPAWYMTVDPAIISDWENDRVYSSVAVTAGRAVGKVGGGVAQVYLKPGIFIGNDRPADWSFEVGFRVIGF
ncbi:hypothetical protein JWJ88_09725 [Paracoccus methylovorus]|uniref:Transporter n=1 Tax=Paracoccus methylovorus TaxID=2812658 RepID=A0ABX7JHL3_9RHOB|nr:hypothetical protein [Paracoccus methylovorus]QRZ12868.1 hypothetical protein JWJ88_09725 [Paracoccus methylovorus]